MAIHFSAIFAIMAKMARMAKWRKIIAKMAKNFRHYAKNGEKIDRKMAKIEKKNDKWQMAMCPPYLCEFGNSHKYHSHKSRPA